MKVILLKDVRNVGRKDEVKTVADGFAANFLLPQNLAVTANPEKVAALERAQEAAAAGAAAESAEFDERIRSLAGGRIEIAVRASEKGGLFKAIAAADITRAIEREKKIRIPEDSVHLETPIKTTGEHLIELHGKTARAEITLAAMPAK